MNADKNQYEMHNGPKRPAATAFFNPRLSAFIRGSFFLLLLPILLTAGCQPFVLTDDFATDKVLATKYWANLEKQYSQPLVCWVVAVRPDSRELYIGTDKTSHITRIRDCRVTADGRVWVNSDTSFRTDRWIVVK